MYQRVARGMATWLDEHQEGVGAVLVAMHLYGTLQPEARRLAEKWGDSEWGHLLWELDFSNALGVMFLLDHRQDETLEAVLEPALTDDQFLTDIKAALDDAPLSAANREQLAAGLDYMAQRKYVLAVPLLIIPLEGAFWQVAEDVGLVERIKERMHFTSESGRSGRAGSVEAVLEPLGVDDDFRRFLVGLVYSTSGNPFRHGNALGGWRRCSLMLVVALAGWLDLYGPTIDEPGLLASTFAIHTDAFAVARQLFPALNVVAENHPESVELLIGMLMSAYARGEDPALPAGTP
jgi:hypothetical protein